MKNNPNVPYTIVFMADALTDTLPTALKYIVAIALVWVVLGVTVCSCCKYTIRDILQLVFHAIYKLLSGSDEVSVEVENIHKKTCECDSPWYSPCVIWGSKSAKEGGCAKDDNKEANTLENGVDSSSLGSHRAKESFASGCAATNTDVGATGSAFVRNNDILPNRGGNRMKMV
jgi:hypothetical protein